MTDRSGREFGGALSRSHKAAIALEIEQRKWKDENTTPRTAERGRADLNDREAVLYVNDTPDRRTDGGVDGGYVYDTDRPRHVVAVTFVTPDRDCVRVSFDPRTGEPSIQRYREDERVA